jgi:sulfoxide reductase heme-binding subunit YedZ
VQALGDMTSLPLLWWTARSIGLVSYAALVLAVLFGVMVGARGAGGLVAPPVVRELHGRWALAAVVLALIHVLAVVVDPRSGVSPLAVVVPLASSVRTGPVALGTVALLGLLVVYGSTLMMKRLPLVVWRAVHASAFGVLLLGALHGVTAGADAAAPSVRALLLGSLAAVMGMVVLRVLVALRPGQATPTGRA